MLRSASTPLFGSLLSSFSESSIHGSSPFHETFHKSCHTNKIHYQQNLHGGSVHLAAVSSNSSPITSDNGFRRAQSEGNLDCLAYGSDEEHSLPSLPQLKSTKKCLKLETILSFSCCGREGQREEEEEEEVDEEENEVLGFGCSMEEAKVMFERTWDVGYNEERTLVVDGGLSNSVGDRSGGGDGNNWPSRFHGGDGEDMNQTEEYYERMLQENPSNPLILRNYAEFLLQSKGDPIGAEKLCSRAILADPRDGEILSFYAQLSWRLYRDEDKAANYFDRAVSASPESSHVHAAYAKFLWEVEEDDEDCEVGVEVDTTSCHMQILNAYY